MIAKKAEGFSLSNVKITDSYISNAFNKEVSYLLSLDTDRLLAGFRETAGIDTHGKKRYAGWENLLIGGHTLGHYATACVNAYISANADDSARSGLLEKIRELAFGLKECQDKTGTGFIFGAAILDPDNIELQFDNIENNLGEIFTQAWVPWYTMHKIISGLVSMAEMTCCSTKHAPTVELIRKTSLNTLSGLADWVYNRVDRWSEETHQTVLSVEYGGMNDCLFDTFLLTGRPEHLKAALAFDEISLFKRVAGCHLGDDVLNDIHANTTIPKFMGALKHYYITGEKEYLDYAVKFWELVNSGHTYVTGGNSEGEHFGRDNILAAEMTNVNCETCNSYNMLKLTKLLYELTEDVAYADWYENTYINSILASQNPQTGMTTYFQPMATGYFKVYSTPESKFWCCTGSGMENFSKPGEAMYFYCQDGIIINRYFSSELISDEIRLIQKSTVLENSTAHFELKNDYSGKLYFRLPDWLADSAEIIINGTKSISVDRVSASKYGYLVLSGPFTAGTVLDLTLPMNITAHGLKDSTDTFAFKYGPVVLSALLGTDNLTCGINGVDVTVPAEKIISRTYIPSASETVGIRNGSVADFLSDINNHMVRKDSDSRLTFELNGTDSRLTFVPHFSQHSERYGLYFTFAAL